MVSEKCITWWSAACCDTRREEALSWREKHADIRYHHNHSQTDIKVYVCIVTYSLRASCFIPQHHVFLLYNWNHLKWCPAQTQTWWCFVSVHSMTETEIVCISPVCPPLVCLLGVWCCRIQALPDNQVCQWGVQPQWNQKKLQQLAGTTLLLPKGNGALWQRHFPV